MSANVFLQHVAETQKPSVLYSYPTTAYVVKWQTNDGEVHLILGPSTITPSSHLTGAPNKSIAIVGDAMYFKNGDFGAKDGTWETVTSS